MAGFEILQSMLDAAMKQAGEESSMLLGQNLTVAASDVLNTDRKSYLCGEDGAIYVVGVESREAYPGRFYLLFSLGDAIVMSSILLGIPAPRVQEKRRLSIQEPDDVDAFGEIANQIIGSFNSVFQPKLPDKVHLKLLTPQKYIPEIDTLSDEVPFPEGSYLMYRAPLEISGYEMSHLDILIPHPLANLFDPQPEVSEEEASAGASAEAAAEEAPAAAPGVILVLGDEEGRKELLEGLSESGCSLMDAPLGADLPRLFSYGDDFKVAVVSLRGTSDRDLSICKRLVPMMNKVGGAVMLCAPEWTRNSVLKALKAGAKDILVSPTEPTELTTRVGRILTPC
jgi:DNA-binding NarL/FixJ family response regulator